MLVTREHIQRVGDEDTLVHFLEEKLNLPIPEGVTLAQITLPLPLSFFGLDGAIAEQIIDIQDFSGIPQEVFGERSLFLIRFRREQGYPEILRKIAEGLSQKNISPAKITFICTNEYFRPFSFAYFNDAEPENWHAAVLKILAWTQDNTYIQTSYEHELPIGSFAEFTDEDNAVDESVLPSAPDSVDTPEDAKASLGTFTTRQPVNRDSQQIQTDGNYLLAIPQNSESQDESVLPDAPDSVDTPEETEASLETFATAGPVNRDSQQTRTERDSLLATPQNSESQQAVSVPNPVRKRKIKNFSIIPVLPADLLHKLQNTGAPLGHYWNIHSSIIRRCVEAFIIDERKREYLIREDANSSPIIIPVVRRLEKKKWEMETVYLIWISSSLYKQWPWSYIEDESEAEQIFAQTYPAISRHLIDYKSSLKSREFASKGKYYWELCLRELKRENYPEFYQPKIVYPFTGNTMRSAYSTLEACILNSSSCIPTDDLSLLAILNSKLFGWYAQAQFRNSIQGTTLFFTKKSMEKSPIAFRSENQKMELSFIVERILNDPNSPQVPGIEKEIDALVYELYKLTDAEIALIEKGINP